MRAHVIATWRVTCDSTEWRRNVIALFCASCDCGFGVGDYAKEVKSFLVTKRVQNKLYGVKIGQIGAKFQCASLSFLKKPGFLQFHHGRVISENKKKCSATPNPSIGIYIYIYIYTHMYTCLWRRHVIAPFCTSCDCGFDRAILRKR